MSAEARWKWKPAGLPVPQDARSLAQQAAAVKEVAERAKAVVWGTVYCKPGVEVHCGACGVGQASMQVHSACGALRCCRCSSMHTCDEEG